MDILHVITRLILGGAQQNTIMSCAAQVKAGHRVGLVYGPIYGPEGSLLEEARKSGAELIEVRTMLRPILPPTDVVCYAQLRRLIRQWRPEVVHTHSTKAGIVGRAAAWDERVPAVIHTIHGLPFHERQLALVHGLYVRSERWAAKRCHRLLGVTQAMCDAFRENRIGEPAQFDVVPSGMDISSFETSGVTREEIRRELGIPLDVPVVGIVARLDKLKGQDDMLDIFPELARRLPGVRLLIVGGGWHKKALEDRVKAEGLGPNVVMTGLVPPERVAAMFRAIDVKVLPSYQEGQPRTMVQALLSGCAIVGYEAGGIPEICIDGKTGRLAPVGDRKALADAVVWMFEHPAERERMSEAGRVYARERFDVRAMIRRLEEIYTEALAGKGGGR
ncbi:MAG: glycosyltransferase family 4 protein [Planctomycetota bacterium]|nr:glycosyltransferase family 4 protein [Planctomycetota bacterium]